MTISIKLSEALINNARRIAGVYHRTVSEQIEYYFRLAAIAEENPCMPFSVIREIMKADAEQATQGYTFD